MSELSELKKQNKHLKKLLENAVELLNRYKYLLKEADTSPVSTKAKPKRAKAKKRVKP